MRLYNYTVQGDGIFPLDMLRHSCYWPTDTVSVNAIGKEPSTRVVVLQGIQQPSIERWKSCGWIVGSIWQS